MVERKHHLTIIHYIKYVFLVQSRSEMYDRIHPRNQCSITAHIISESKNESMQNTFEIFHKIGLYHTCNILNI